jgi:WD40-like Beta Propeller Repeat
MSGRSISRGSLEHDSPSTPPTRYSPFGHMMDVTSSLRWVLPLKGAAKAQPFMQTEFSEVHGAFSPDGRWVAYQSTESGRAFAVGEVKTLFASRMRQAAFAGVLASNYDVSADGQRFLIAATEGGAVEPPITLLVNWAAALRP